MPKAVIVAGHKSEHQNTWGTAFREGLLRHGWHAEIDSVPGDCDMLVMWSVRRQDRIRSQTHRGGTVCIMERGYIGDRHKWTSISFGGGLNGRAYFPHVESSLDRLNKHHPGVMSDWKPAGGGLAVICGQVPTDMSVKHLNVMRVYVDLARAMVERGWNVEFRPHPLAAPRRTPDLKWTPEGETLAQMLARADAVVTINSNSGVDAALAGVPVYALDIGSMAYDVAAHSCLDEPVTPCRNEWAGELSWKQWNYDEIASGECWARIGHDWEAIKDVKEAG